MKNIRTLIIDDNDKARVALKSDVEDYCPTLEIVGEADGVEKGYIGILKKRPDLIFLDIKMGDGTGFDLLEKFKDDKDITFEVIFTTAYDEYAIKAFKYSAVDYLLKPIDPDDLENSVARIKIEEKPQQDLSQLLKQLTQKTPEKLSLPEQDRIHIVAIKDIIRCESDKNYTSFTMNDGRVLTVSKTLKEYEQLLESHHFLRVHHSHLVNMDAIVEVIKVEGTFLKMKDNSQVPVSLRKKDGLLKAIKEYWGHL